MDMVAELIIAAVSIIGGIALLIFTLTSKRIPSSWAEVFYGKERIAEQEEREKKLDEFLQNQEIENNDSHNIVDRLEQLNTLLNKGFITQDEFISKRKDLLNEL